MIEIARTYKVPFEPDPLVMKVNKLLLLGYYSYVHIAGLHCVVLSPNSTMPTFP